MALNVIWGGWLDAAKLCLYGNKTREFKSGAQYVVLAFFIGATCGVWRKVGRGFICIDETLFSGMTLFFHPSTERSAQLDIC